MAFYIATPTWLTTGAEAEAWAPPPPVDYLGWAKRNIVFSDRESPFPGSYNEDLFPYFSEILEALSPDDPCRTITLMKSAQLGGTVVANIFTCGSLDLNPGDLLYTHPTENNAQRWSKTKLVPMLRNTKPLQQQFPQKGRDGADSVLYKERKDGRGAIMISGANSPASLSMVSMPRQVQDDLAKWEMNSAGDPESQADSRSEAYEFAKVLKISTPMIEPGCRISNSFEQGSQEYFHVPCPECNELQVLEWENMLANLDEDNPAGAHFTCIHCGSEILEHHRSQMVKTVECGGRARWIARNPKAKRTHRSFHIWSAYSVLQSFSRVAESWIRAKGNPEKEQTFTNDIIGLPYRIEGNSPPWEGLRDRALKSDYQRGSIPVGGLLLTMGIDCQIDRIEWQVIAWGRNGQRWVIDVGVVPHHISEKEAFPLFDAVVENTWINSVGRRIAIDRVAIDGNAFTEDVWNWSRRFPVSKLIMVRGVGSEIAPLIALVKRQMTPDGKRRVKWSKRFYNFAASVLKMRLYRKLRKEDQSDWGFVHFPAGLDDDYFMQLTAERRVRKWRNGFATYVWDKDKNQANEALDTMNQAETAANNLRISEYVDAHWDRLEATRMAPPDEPQMDLETYLAQPEEFDVLEKQSISERAQKSRPTRKQSRRRTVRRGSWVKHGKT